MIRVRRRLLTAALTVAALAVPLSAPALADHGPHDSIGTATHLTAVADPPGVYESMRTSIGGQLTSGGAGVAAAELTVTRQAITGALDYLPSVTTASDGTYHFADAPTRGMYTYFVRYAGSSTLAEAKAAADVTVWSPETYLDFSVEQGTASDNVIGLAWLTYEGPDDTSGRTVELVRTTEDGTTTQLPPVTTGPNGDARFYDSPQASGLITYTATVGANGVHPARSETATIRLAAATSVNATADAATVYVGDTVNLRGTVSSMGALLVGATVDITRSGCSTVVWRTSTTTGPDGRWAARNLDVPAGNCTYTITYAGDSTHRGSSTSVGVSVVRRPADLTLTAVRGTGKDKKYVYVTGHLGGGYTNRTITLTAQSAGGAEFVLASGPVDANGNLTARHQYKTTTTYRAKYDGDVRYLPATVERVL